MLPSLRSFSTRLFLCKKSQKMAAGVSPLSSTKALTQEMKRLREKPVEGFRVGLVDDNNIYEWEVAIFGPPDTLYQGILLSVISLLNEPNIFMKAFHRPPGLNSVAICYSRESCLTDQLKNFSGAVLTFADTRCSLEESQSYPSRPDQGERFH